MKTRLLHDAGGKRTYAVVFDTGDEVTSGLESFARDAGLSGASFSGIGAFSAAVLGYFDWERKDYDEIRVDEQVEVLALTGDVAVENGEPQVHAHVVVARRDGSARGGHLLRAHVRPTLEVVLTETPAHLRKRLDRETGLALIDLEEEG